MVPVKLMCMGSGMPMCHAIKHSRFNDGYFLQCNHSEQIDVGDMFHICKH